VQKQKRGKPAPPAKFPERVIEPYDDGWSEYDAPFVIDAQTG